MLYIARIDDLYEPFDPLVHARHDIDQKKCTIVQEENAAATCQITFPNPGVGLLSAAAWRYVLISESDSGNPADAVLIFRGRVVGLPVELQSVMITTELIAAPLDLDAKLRAKAVEVYGSPWSDRLYGDMPEDPEAALAARGATWHIDRRTHEIAITDILVGSRVVDIGHNHAASAFQIRYGEPPAQKARLQVAVDWEQGAAGNVDIAGQLQRFKSLALTSEDGVRPEMNTGTGWSVVSDAYRIVSTAPVQLDRGYRQRQKYQGWTYVDTVKHEFYDAGTVTEYRHRYAKLPEYEEVQKRLDSCSATEYEFDYLIVAYDYRQQRRETITLEMTMPTQDIVGTVPEVDMGLIVLDDPTDDLDTPAWYPGRPGVEGEHVQYDGKRWAYASDHAMDYFYFRAIINGQLVSITTPGFVAADSVAAIDRISPKIVGTARGTEMIEHALMLMRARLRWRLRCLNVTVRPNDWSTMLGMDMDDELRCDHPRLGFAQGKVVKTTMVWDGSTGRYGVVEIGCAVGTGSAGEGDIEDVDYIVDAEAVAEPVLAGALPLPQYAVARSEIINDADAQAALAGQAVADGIDPTNVIANNPTRVVVDLQDLSSVRIIDRKITISAELLDSPQGFDTEAI